MDPGQQKEEFSRSLLGAVAALADCVVDTPSQDVGSRDRTLTSPIHGRVIREPSIVVQLKCTERLDLSKDPMPLQLRAKNYRELQGPRWARPKILVVVPVPRDISRWLKVSHYRSLLRHSIFWVSLRDAPELPADQGSKTISIPHAQLLTPEALVALMQRAADGEPI